MLVKDRQALLIHGKESGFLAESKRWKTYLIDEAKFDPAAVSILSGAYISNDVLVEATDNFFSSANKNPAIIIYSGHGNIGSIDPRQDKASPGLSYDNFAQPFLGHKGNFVFINSCCCSGSAIAVFKKKKLLPRKGLLLASAEANKDSYGDDYCNQLMEAYRYKQKILNKPNWRYSDWRYSSKLGSGGFSSVRCGKSLDYLLFARD